MRKLIINSSKQDAINLALIFGKVVGSDKEEDTAIDVPEWVEWMFLNAADKEGQNVLCDENVF
jgi:hypothetical protein